MRAGVDAGCFVPRPEQVVKGGMVTGRCGGDDGADASGQGVTAERGGPRSPLSHPVTLSGRCRAEMSLKHHELYARNHITAPSLRTSCVKAPILSPFSHPCYSVCASILKSNATY